MLALGREEKGAEVRSEHWRAATRHAEVQHGLVTATRRDDVARQLRRFLSR